MTTNLRDHLLSSLESLPNIREFHLHVLVSAPRKNSSLYIFAKPLPRVYLQDIIILCSEQPTPDAPRIMVTAIEASVYHIPSTFSLVLYIAKVDTTGQGIHPSPAMTLVQSLITFYASPSATPIRARHLWIHLFARAQGQYLFPNSSEFPGKQPLTDVKLCIWWRRVLSDAVEAVQAKTSSIEAMSPFYLLPGYTEFEASNMLNVASQRPSGVGWVYGHPYTQTEIPLPCPRGSHGHNLGYLIPSFDDDPKSRFVDDIAYNTNGDIKSPAKKRPRTDSYDEEPKEKSDKRGKDELPLGELGKVAADEFWERMSFRQECASGAVTGFFAVGIKYVEDKESTASEVITGGPGQVSSQMIKRVLTLLTTGVEFSTRERGLRATETVEKSIERLCEGLGVPTSITSKEQKAEGDGTEGQTPERETAPPVQPSTPPRRVTLKRDDMEDKLPNTFSEPETSLETYRGHVYGKIKVCNEMGKEKRRGETGTEAVRMLTARRKRRK